MNATRTKSRTSSLLISAGKATEKKNPQDITSSSALKSERLGEGGWAYSLPFTSLGVGLHALITAAQRGAHAEEGTPNPPTLGQTDSHTCGHCPISSWPGGWRQLGAAHTDPPQPVGHSDPSSLSPTPLEGATPEENHFSLPSLPPGALMAGRRGGGRGVGQRHHLPSPPICSLSATSKQQTRTQMWVNPSTPLERGEKGATSLQPQKPPACHHEPFPIHPHSSSAGKVQRATGELHTFLGGNNPRVPSEPRHKSTAEHLPRAGAAPAAGRRSSPFLHLT